MNILGIIPARGGSVGIPQKNIQICGGEPLIARAIRAAKNSKFITRLIVSSDCSLVGDIARGSGAEVSERPAELSGSFASSESALLHVIEELRTQEGYFPDIIVFIQCTAPLTIAEDIDGTLLPVVKRVSDCAFAAAKFHSFIWRDTCNRGATGVNHDYARRLMRQERGEEFVEAGAVYVMDAPGFMRAKHRFFGKIAIYPIPAARLGEIDTWEDLRRIDGIIMGQTTESVSRY